MCDKNREDDFDNTFQELIINEGGYANDPYDSGGKTIYGITSRDYPSTYNVVKTLFDDGKTFLALDTTKRFYYIHFWDDLYKEIPDNSLAFKLFDLSVNRGRKTAVKLLQDTLFFDFGKTIARDGIFGQITLGAIKSIANQELLYRKYIERNEVSYRTLSKFWRFGKSWLNRLLKRVYV